jgi:hypothetical protein
MTNIEKEIMNFAAFAATLSLHRFILEDIGRAFALATDKFYEVVAENKPQNEIEALRLAEPIAQELVPLFIPYATTIVKSIHGGEEE